MARCDARRIGSMRRIRDLEPMYACNASRAKDRSDAARISVAPRASWHVPLLGPLTALDATLYTSKKQNSVGSNSEV